MTSPFTDDRPDWSGLTVIENQRAAEQLQEYLEDLWPEFRTGNAPTAFLNGRIPLSALGVIPGGHLRKDAAASWNDMRDYIGRKHGVWIMPLGPNSAYRTYDNQVFQRNSWCARGQCGNAAIPGTSNHGWGIAVDVASTTMVFYIRKYGHIFGWKKTEAFNEWWHYNYVGGYKPRPRRKPLPKVLSDKETKWSNSLRFHRHERKEEDASGHGPRWRAHNKWAKRYDERLRKHANSLDGKRFRRPARRKVLRDVIAGKYNY